MGGHTVGGCDYYKKPAPTTTLSNPTTGVLGFLESVLGFLESVRGFLESPRGTVIRIEGFVVLAALVLLLLATFGSRRRRSTSWLIQNGLLGAFTLSPSLVTYTIGSMQSSAVKSNMYLLWAMSLYILAGCADSITAYSIDDNDQITRLVYQCILNYIYVLMVFVASFTYISGGSSLVFPFLVVPALLKFFHRIAASELASKSWNLNKMVADYMYEEHTMENGGQPWDPVSMKGYRYPVDWPLVGSIAEQIPKDGPKVMDIEKIWGCPDKTVLSPELKDVCLSFSLFHLLRRRFFGFACGESTLQKTHNFVFKGLLLAVPENEEGGATCRVDYNRVFKVIEVELAFMYDFFFTKYAAIYYGSWLLTIFSMVSPILIAVVVFLVATHRVFSTSRWDAGPVAVNTTAADVVITVLILGCTACLELLQLLFYWTSIWGRVSFVCQYLRRGSSCMMRFKELLTKIGVNCASRERYWQHKLGQYSLLDSVSRSRNRLFICWELTRLTCRMLLFHQKPAGFIISPVRGAGKKPAVGLPVEVKEALVESLVRTDGKLTDGASSLVSNGAGHLLWACEQDMHSSDTSCSQKLENHAHRILTWHIATCYSEMAALRSFCPYEGTYLKLHVEVATKLSKYCAYLVVFEPRLLPGHHYDTSCVFDQVAEEAMRHLQHEEDKYEAMKKLPLPDTQETTFQRGVKLGMLLEEMEDATLRWKVLADFWAELMLYVAPSDNVKDHIESLAKGGELVTHLWALLSHAGILKREEQYGVVGDV